MPSLVYPDSLDPKAVDKDLAALKQKPKALTLMIKALEACRRDADKVDLSLLKDFSSATERVLATRLESITKLAEEPSERLNKSAIEAEKAANALRTELQKSPDKGDRAVQAALRTVQAVAVDSRNYAADVARAVKFYKGDVESQLATLRKQEKAAEDEGDEGDEKSREQVATRIAAALKLARQTGGAKPMKFMIGVIGSKQMFVYVAKAVSGSTPGKIKEWMNAGSQGVTFYKGDLLFEDKAHTFVGINIPTGGFATRIRRSLLDLTQKSFKIRVRRPTGERDEAEGDDGDDDDVFEAAKKDAGADMGRVRRLAERQKKLGRQMADVLDDRADRRTADELKASLRTFDQLVANRRYDEAERLLNDIERDLLDAKARGERALDEAQRLFMRRLKGLEPSIREFLATDKSDVADEAKNKHAEVSGLLKEVRAAGDKAKSARSVEAFEEATDLLGALAQKIEAFEDEQRTALAREVDALDPKKAAEAAREAARKLATLRGRLETLARDAPASAKGAVDKAREALKQAEKDKDAASVARLEQAVDALDTAAGDEPKADGGKAKRDAEDRLKKGLSKLQTRIQKVKAAAPKSGRKPPEIEGLDEAIKAAAEAKDKAAKSGTGTDLAGIDKAIDRLEQQLGKAERALKVAA